jgi:voltage-gated potassium channel
VTDGLRRGSSGSSLEQSPVSLPSRRVSPLGAVGTRAAIAAGLLVLATVIVYLGRSGYRDAARPGQPLNFLGAAYYSAVTLSTTGYGDIVPVSSVARLVNTVVITPIRVIFLIVLIGTTLEVLTERTRHGWRLTRWRSKVTGHTVVVGYGSKGRSVLTTLREAGQAATSIVVVDDVLEVTSEANRAGYAAVTGDATRRDVLGSAETAAASRLVIAVGRDDTAVLIALTARQLSPGLTIIAAVREAENEPLLRQSGADQVVVSSAAAGRLLGLTTIEPAAGQVMAELLGWGRGLDLTERPPSDGEIGRPARVACTGLIAVLREGSLLAADDPRAGQVQPGDRLVLVSAAAAARPQRPDYR